MSSIDATCPHCKCRKVVRLGYLGTLSRHCMCKECKSVFDIANEIVQRKAAEKMNDIMSEERTLQSILEEFTFSGLDDSTQEFVNRTSFITSITGKHINVQNLLMEISKYEQSYAEQVYKNGQ